VKPKEFLQQAYRRTRDANLRFGWLKYNADLALIRGVSKLVPKSPHPFHRYVFGRPLPRTYGEIFKKTQIFSGSTEKELQWITNAVAQYPTEANSFLKARTDFDTKLVLGDYAAATDVLRKVERDFGVSVWGLNNTFLLRELSEGLQANTRFLSEFNSREDLDSFLKVLANFLSVRCERQLSHENFQLKLSRYLMHFDSYPELRALFAHLLGSDPVEFDLRYYDTVLYYISEASIIDRTLQLLRFLGTVVALRSSNLPALVPYIQLLEKCIQDPELRNIAIAAGAKNSVITEDFDRRVMQALDYYTVGDYENAKALCSALLLTKPTVFQLYELHVKCMIFSNDPFTSPFPKDSLADEIITAIDSVLRKTQDYSRSIDLLSRAAEWLHYTPLAAGCRYIVVSETTPANIPLANGRVVIASEFLNPKIASLCEDRRNRKLIMSLMGTAYPDSVTTSFWSIITNAADSLESVVFPETISPDRRTFYTASVLIEREDFANAIPLLEELYRGRLANRELRHYPLYDQVTSVLYGAYLKANETEKALSLYTENYLYDASLVRSLNSEALCLAIESQGSVHLARNIDVPIFYAAITANPQMLYVAYDNFLSAHGYKTPADFISSATNFPTRRASVFLHRVCTQKVMAGSFHFSGTDSLENERLIVCQYLCRVDPTNQPTYSKEIDEITQRVFIRRGIQKVEEGKIYVDQTGIRNAGDKLLRESFRRYLDFATLERSGLRLLDTSKLQITRSLTENQPHQPINLEKLEAEGIRVIFTSHYAVFKELFLDVRDRFISSSEYGLDSYLSVRIRHGTLQGQLRSRFETLHLVSQRDAQSNAYQLNLFWDSNLSGCTPAKKRSIQSLLASFSRDIDGITKHLKDEVIQVRTETRNPGGLFDFRFEDDVLLPRFIKSFEKVTTYQEFIDHVFAMLWNRTEISLERVRHYITVTLKDAFVQRLTALQADVRDAVPDGAASELRANIATCLTAIQNECDRIGRWFTLTGAKYEANPTLEQVLTVCIASINNINPEVQIDPAIMITNDRAFDGQYFFSLFDIIRTLLDNASRHSGTNGAAPEMEISGNVASSDVVLRMRNAITSDVRSRDPVGFLRKRLATIQSRGVSEDIKREGGTGYAKISKILQYDLGRSDASISFDYPIENQFQVELRFESRGLIA
jgi:hypothetical protein